MPKYTVRKYLELDFECEADSPQEAEEMCINANDQGEEFTLIDCQYEITDVATGQQVFADVD